MPVTWPDMAQQVTSVPGSPIATTTIGGKQLPPPDPKFGGVIKEKASESKAWWAQRIVPLKSAPNVLLIMMDDVGFGEHSSLPLYCLKSWTLRTARDNVH